MLFRVDFKSVLLYETGKVYEKKPINNYKDIILLHIQTSQRSHFKFFLLNNHLEK